MRFFNFAALVASSLVCGGMATAQDSVSKQQGLPGDGVGNFDTNEQLNTYVVDLAQFQTAWGSVFGLGPIAKSSSSDSAQFFSSIVNSQAASSTLKTNVPYPFADYSVWTAQGGGINNDTNLNDAGVDVSPTGMSNQFAVAFNEFGGTDYEGNIGAFVNYDPANPGRLFVARIPTAINEIGDLQSTANFGFGAVDSDGNVVLRGDDFGLNGGNQVTGNNIYRIGLANRSANALNVINGSGPSDTGVAVVSSSSTTHNTPSILPESLGGPLYLGTNFNTEYVFEGGAASAAHLGGLSDHRGGVSFSATQVFANTVGTGAISAKDGAGDTRVMAIWGVAANGAASGTFNMTPPLSITDNSSALAWPSVGTTDQFVHHNSQTAFEGGNGQISIGEDASGNILVAVAVTAGNANADNGYGGIAVARFDPADPAGTLEWTMAAYNDPAGGKSLLSGPNGAALGQCVELNAVTGGVPNGPSFSVPCIDGAGNIWFLAAVERFGGMFSDFDAALVRAVYDPTDFSYQLEEVVEVGDVFAGVNSATNYQVRRLEIADSNSVDSGTMFSGNIVGGTWNNVPTAGLSPRDPNALGGLVFTAELVYDVNNDGMYDKVTGANGDPLSGDQEYNVVMYLGSLNEAIQEPVVTYCTAKASSSGCLAGMTTSSPTSQPVSGANDYQAVMVMGQAQRPGIFFTTNTAQAAIPFQGGTLCMAPPLRRSPIQFSFGSGSNCDGSFMLTVNDGVFIPAGFDAGPGNTSFVQAWYRDPVLADGFGTALSNAIQLDFQ